MTRRIERISVMASITVIFLLYLGILTMWLQAALAGQSSNSLYYDALSRAFLKGQLHTLQPPSSTLLNLPDPYDPFQNRLEGLDLSLYKGKLYLYWGPVPALSLAILHLVISKPISDAFVVWFSICGLLLSNTAIILWMKRRIFPDLPGWFTILGIFLIGLSNPIPWMLGRPIIYEAAIAAGQFFLVTGMYLLITSFEGNTPRVRRLFLAAVFWALAIGTRFTLVFAVGFLTLFSLVLIYLNRPDASQRQILIRLSTALLTPLIVMLGLLGLYNYLRFDSFLEFGLQYQMSGTNIHLLYKEGVVTSIHYALPAFLDYFFMPIRGLSTGYPFVLLQRENNFAYHGSPVTFEYMVGMFWILPFIVYAFVPVGQVVVKAVRYLKLPKAEISERLRILLTERKSVEAWIPLLFGGTALSGLAPLLLFFFWTMRYEEDFLPALILLSIYGFGTAFRALSGKPELKRLLIASAFFLALISILLGVYFGFNSPLLHYCLYESIPACNY